MIMGNFLNGGDVAGRMVAPTPSVGLSHPTVVPANFEAGTDESPERDEDGVAER